MKAKHIICAVVVLSAWFAACKKDQDTTPPEIAVYSPVENATFDVFERISVQADIRDVSVLQFINLRLVNSDLVPVLPSVSFTPDNSQYHLTHAYPIDDIHMVSGVYYLQIKASDGLNEANSYTKLYIGEVPLKRTNIVLVSTPSNAQVVVSLMDDAYQISDLMTYHADYAASALSSYYQYIGILPASNGDFNAYDISNGSLKWGISTPGSFEGLGFDEEVMYVCYHDGRIQGYNHSGGQVYSAYSYENWYPEKCFGHGEMLLVQEKFVSLSDRKLSAYYKLTGENSNKGFPMDFDIIAAGERDQNNVFLFVNENNTGKILLMQTSGQNYGYWEPHSLGSGQIYDAAQAGPDEYIIAHSSGLLWYRYSNNSLTSFASVVAQRVAYDKAGNQVIAAVGNEVRIYSYPLGQLMGSALNANAIQDLYVLYNK